MNENVTDARAVDKNQTWKSTFNKTFSWSNSDKLFWSVLFCCFPLLHSFFEFFFFFFVFLPFFPTDLFNIYTSILRKSSKDHKKEQHENIKITMMEAMHWHQFFHTTTITKAPRQIVSTWTTKVVFVDLHMWDPCGFSVGTSWKPLEPLEPLEGVRICALFNFFWQTFSVTWYTIL